MVYLVKGAKDSLQGGNMRTFVNKRVVSAICLSVIVLVAMGPSARADGLAITGTAGWSIPTGEVRDAIVGGGPVFGGKLMLGLNNRFSIGGGGTLSIHGGSGEELFGVDITDAGVGLTFEGSTLFYLMTKEQSQVRPFLGLHAGFGILGWGYTDEAAIMFSMEAGKVIDGDSIAYLFLAPEGGIELGLNDNLCLFGAARVQLNSFTDETSEGFEWDLDGGNFIQFYGGATYNF